MADNHIRYRVTLDGMIAPFVLGGAINRDAFTAYVKRISVPELRPGDIVIIINLPSHKRPVIEKLINDAGGPSSNSCRPIALTSIPSKWHSPS